MSRGETTLEKISLNDDNHDASRLVRMPRLNRDECSLHSSDSEWNYTNPYCNPLFFFFFPPLFQKAVLAWRERVNDARLAANKCQRNRPLHRRNWRATRRGSRLPRFFVNPGSWNPANGVREIIEPDRRINELWRITWINSRRISNCPIIGGSD